MEKKINKFENPSRIAELDPKNTLIRLGFKEDMVLCDIGAGSGVFSIPAAQISSCSIFALDISDDMINILERKKTENKAQNLTIQKVHSDKFALENGICDMAVMVTVLHEIEDKSFMLGEIKRILKANGKLAIIEFHKKSTPIGPPINHRISQEQVIELCEGKGFKSVEKFELGDNFYCVVFQAK